MEAMAGSPGFFTARRRPLPDLAALREDLRKHRPLPAIPDALLTRYRAVLASPPTTAPAAAPPTVAPHAAPRPSVDQRLIQRITMGFNLYEMQQIEELGFRAYLDRQLDPRSLDDNGLEDAIRQNLPSISLSPAQRLLHYHDEPIVPILEFLIATVYRAIYSPRQLFERMVVLWTDHFNIDLLSDFGIWLKPSDDREVIRRYALSTFPNLLRATAYSPAMLDYLTNNSNVKAHPNENYARELMELHTLGADNGYTQEDVRQVARCFTGWTYHDYRAGIPLFGSFFFDETQHDFGPKVVLGHAIPGDTGIADGELVLRILGQHPNTARTIARKLLRHFWGYEPSAALVEKVAQVYLATGGDIKAMLRNVLTRFRMGKATPKLKRPYELMVSTLRALFARLESPVFLLQSLLAAGHLPYNWGPPNGYPDSAGYWSGLLLPRWNFAAEFLTHPAAGIAIDLPFLDPALPVAELVARLARLLTRDTLSESTRQVLTDFLSAEAVTPSRVREAIGLVVAAPEFQQY